VPPPPPVVVLPPPGVAGPPGVSFADQVFAMPAVTGCISRRKFPITIRRPKGVKFKKLTITVNGRAKIKAKGLKARKLKAKVNLRGLPRGKVVVKIVAQTTDGRKLVSKRKYKTCSAKKAKTKKSRKKKGKKRR